MPIAYAIVAGWDADNVNKKGINNSVYRLALCSVIAALSLATMMLTGIIPVGTFAFPCFAGIFISVIVVEYGFKWAMTVYGVVACLSLFLAGDKEAVIYFIMIFGYYPVLKAVFESKIKSKPLQYVLKFAVFNAAAVISFFLGTYLLSISAEEYTIFGVYVPLVFLVAGNFLFILYDLCVSAFVMQYVRRIRDKIFKKK